MLKPMPMFTSMHAKHLITIALLALAGAATAQEAVIRKALAERLPNLPKIDEVTRSPVPGLWEVRYGGSEIIYSDDKGEFIFVNGSLVETKTRILISRIVEIGFEIEF